MTPYQSGQLAALEKRSGIGGTLAWEGSKMVPLVGAVPAFWDAGKDVLHGNWSGAAGEALMGGLSLASPFTAGAATGVQAGLRGARAASIGMKAARAARLASKTGKALKEGKLLMAAKASKQAVGAGIRTATGAVAAPLNALGKARKLGHAKLMGQAGPVGSVARGAHNATSTAGKVVGQVADKTLGKIPGIRNTAVGRYGAKRIAPGAAQTRTGHEALFWAPSLIPGGGAAGAVVPKATPARQVARQV